MDLRDANLDPAANLAAIAEALLDELGPAAPLARRMLEPVAGEYLIGSPDRAKIRRALAAAAFVAAVLIAANGSAAADARRGFLGVLDRQIRRLTDR